MKKKKDKLHELLDPKLKTEVGHHKSVQDWACKVTPWETEYASIDSKRVLELTERFYYLCVGVEARTVPVVDMAVSTFSSYTLNFEDKERNNPN